LRSGGHAVEELARVDEAPEGQRTVLDAIRSGDVTLVVNTPSPESRPMRDAGAIRRATLAEGILCLTSIDTALAAARALDPEIADDLADIRPLDEWLSVEIGLTAL
jgi:carbamoyl-phosphate synthase large subunit